MNVADAGNWITGHKPLIVGVACGAAAFAVLKIAGVATTHAAIAGAAVAVWKGRQSRGSATAAPVSKPTIQGTPIVNLPAYER